MFVTALFPGAKSLRSERGLIGLSDRNCTLSGIEA